MYTLTVTVANASVTVNVYTNGTIIANVYTNGSVDINGCYKALKGILKSMRICLTHAHCV